MHHDPRWSHEAALENEPVSASKARRFVSVYLAEHRLSYLADDMRLVASELATNAMNHARTPFTVGLADAGESVLLTVRDGSLALPHEVSASVRDSHGRGLAVVGLLSRDWGVTTGPEVSKVVWASFPRRARW
jgi:hypothetical protein